MDIQVSGQGIYNVEPQTDTGLEWVQDNMALDAEGFSQSPDSFYVEGMRYLSDILDGMMV